MSMDEVHGMLEEPGFRLDDQGLLLPPTLAGAPGGAEPPAPASPPAPPAPARYPSTAQQPPTRLPTRPYQAAPPPPVGRLNWIFGLLGTVIGLASFEFPLLCLTVLISLAFSAVGLSRFNRLRRRGANGRGIAIAGLVVGLASAANLVFGITQMFQLGSQLGGLPH